MLPEDRQDTDIPEAIVGRSTGAYGRIFTFYEPCVRSCNCKITVQRVLKVVSTSDNESFSFDSQLKGSLDLPPGCTPHSHLVRSLYLEIASHIQFLTKLSLLLGGIQSRARFNNYHFNTHRFYHLRKGIDNGRNSIPYSSFTARNIPTPGLYNNPCTCRVALSR